MGLRSYRSDAIVVQLTLGKDGSWVLGCAAICVFAGSNRGFPSGMTNKGGQQQLRESRSSAGMTSKKGKGKQHEACYAVCASSSWLGSMMVGVWGLFEVKLSRKLLSRT